MQHNFKYCVWYFVVSMLFSVIGVALSFVATNGYGTDYMFLAAICMFCIAIGSAVPGFIYLSAGLDVIETSLQNISKKL